MGDNTTKMNKANANEAPEGAKRRSSRPPKIIGKSAADSFVIPGNVGGGPESVWPHPSMNIKKMEKGLSLVVARCKKGREILSNDDVRLLCGIGSRIIHTYENSPEYSMSFGVGTPNPIAESREFAEIYDAAVRYVKEVLRNRGERTYAQLRKLSNKCVVFSFMQDFARHSDAQIFDSIPEAAEGPNGEERQSKTSIHPVPFNFPAPVLKTSYVVAVDGEFRRLSKEEVEKVLTKSEAERDGRVFEASVFGERFVELPAIERKMMNEMADWNPDRVRNAMFYAFSELADAGMKPETWPEFLEESLRAEKKLLGKLLVNRETNSTTILELGGGDGRTITQPYFVKGKRMITMFTNANAVISIDYSKKMLGTSKERIANLGMRWQDIMRERGVEMTMEDMEDGAWEISKCAVQKTRLIHGDLATLGSLGIGRNSVDLAISSFNTLGNMGEEDQFEMLRQTREVMRPYTRESTDEPPVLCVTVYKEGSETRASQREFYMKMGLTDTHESGRFTISTAPDKGTLMSQRFKPKELGDIIANAGLEVVSIFQISPIMIAAIAVRWDGETELTQEDKKEIMQKLGILDFAGVKQE